VPRLLAFVVLTCAAFAQDERRITSPNGQIEFRLFIAVQDSNNLSRIAYEVFYHGQPLIKTSFMGLDIEVQEPLLGENVGLTSSSTAKSEKYNSLVAHYMQNGSLGRLIDLEARAYNDGVAFRYIIPRSTPLMEFVLTEEATEFRMATPVTITESKSQTYPSMHVDQTTMRARLSHPYQGTTPLTCPWRIIALNPRSLIVADLDVQPHA
jgi:alpha-glucosidase